jgi:hypothetical protein
VLIVVSRVSSVARVLGMWGDARVCWMLIVVSKVSGEREGCGLSASSVRRLV